ncbi:MAG TPA: S8 family serine peptidase [Acidimicrobiales bacterium]|nr:S8 family serine peptidase [Acidimicrobiales bacterium]
MREGQWHLAYLDIASAHAISLGEGITVAVVDSGIDEHHPDLAGNVLEGADVVVGGNGNGWGDVLGHGTGMAGLIAAHGHGAGNAEGALGIAPGAKILPLRIEAGDGYGGGDALALAVDEAVARGANIISVSINSDGQSYDAVQRALAAGVIVVASAGNEPTDHFMGSPAADPGVVAVGAVGQDGNIADVSVRGSGLAQISLTAPGVDIVSASMDGGYRIGTGTSPSTAIVAGVAALVWSAYPELTSVEVVEHLTETSVDKGAPGRDVEYGFGVVDPVKALTTRPVTTTTTIPPTYATAPVTVPDDEAAAGPVAGGPSASDGGANPGLLLAGGAAVLAVTVAAVTARRRGFRAVSPAVEHPPHRRPPPPPGAVPPSLTPAQRRPRP